MKEIYKEINKKRLSLLSNLFGLNYFNNKIVIDLGCGDGDTSSFLFRLGADVTAIDARLNFIKNLSWKYRGIKTLNFNLENQIKDIKKVDIAISFDLLSHLNNYESHLKNICSISETIILDTLVENLDDVDYYKSVAQNKSNEYYSYIGRGSSFSGSKVEKIFSEFGMNFIRVDDEILNTKEFIYNWEVGDLHKNKLKRFWIASKSKEIIEKIKNQCINKNYKHITLIDNIIKVNNPIIKKIDVKEDCNNVQISDSISSKPQTTFPINSSKFLLSKLASKPKEIKKSFPISIPSSISTPNSLSILEKKDETSNQVDKISIIIPAWKADKFIDQCIDSIICQQNNNIEIEILIGIDNCQDTLNHIQNNPDKFSKDNVKIFYFNEHIGPYVIKNTLSDYASYDKILFFDSDDVMINGMIKETINSLNKNNDIVRYKFYNFNNDNIQAATRCNYITEGVIGIKKSSFFNLNGFEPWLCAADTEFMLRAQSNKYKIDVLRNYFFNRRLHQENLTKINPKIRNPYKEQINIKVKNKNWNLIKKNINNNFNVILFKKNNIVKFTDIFPETEIKGKMSVIIPAWKSEKFIDQCIDSILCQQNNNIEIEILIGIDACQETLNHIQNNPDKYGKDNIKVYYFNENIGPYIIRNTLVDYASYDKILFFDSDDIMINNMISKFIIKLNNFDVVRCQFDNFKNNQNIGSSVSHSVGIFGINKYIFEKLNGFEPWRCSADGEFVSRSNSKNISEYIIKEKLFLRRIHENNLTVCEETNGNSKLRNNYRKIINEKRKNNFKDSFDLKEKVISNCIKINFCKKYLHLIISRVAIKWKYNGKYRNEEVEMSWDDWSKDSIELYDKFCRNSLKNQSCKNYKLISLIDKNIKNFGSRLNNEIIIHADDISQIPDVIKKYIFSLNEKYDAILMTRIDRDDLLKNNFVKNLQNIVDDYLKNNKNYPYYFDIYNNHVLLLDDKKIYKKSTYNDITSPFISIIENINNIECLIYKNNHGKISKIMNGEKNNHLDVIQVIHKNNLLNNKTLTKNNFQESLINLNDYGVNYEK